MKKLFLPFHLKQFQFQFISIASCLPAMHYCKEPGSDFLGGILPWIITLEVLDDFLSLSTPVWTTSLPSASSPHRICAPAAWPALWPPTEFAPVPQCLSVTAQHWTITSLNPLCVFVVIQDKMQLASFAARAHCWLPIIFLMCLPKCLFL